jgi:hypothetical protein
MLSSCYTTEQHPPPTPANINFKEEELINYVKYCQNLKVNEKGEWFTELVNIKIIGNTNKSGYNREQEEKVEMRSLFGKFCFKTGQRIR